VAVILAHGQGLDPDSQVVGPLRRAIHDRLGWQTLSLQLPVVPGERNPARFLEYAATFPEAYRTIQAGLDFLRKEQGVERVYLLGYSMGARMVTGFLATHSDAGVAGLVGVGMLGGGEEPLNTNLNLKKLTLPVLDLHGDTDPDAKSAAFRKGLFSERHREVVLAGAHHDYKGYERALADAVIAWLEDQARR